MKKPKKNKKKWSNKFYQAKIGTWNCWSLSNERYQYCKELRYDILGLTELHNTQAKEQFKDKIWIHSAQAQADAQGKCSDPAAGVAIMLSPRMAAKTLDSGHVGTRIAWARIKGPICNIFYIVVYIPHKGRTVAPKAEDTIAQLEKLLQTVRKSECVIIGGDFNCQLQRSVQGCTGKWCMTKYENKGHGNKILDMMRAHDLCAVGTFFKPKRKKWQGQYRHCNATYIPKDGKRRPTKLDYLCVSNRWKSMVINTDTKWGPSIHRFGHQFDHALVSATWRWRTKKTEQIRRPDFKAMDSERWAVFDSDLRIRIEESRGKRYETPQSTGNMGKCDSHDEYAQITELVGASIAKVVPSKTRAKKNGRIVSAETKAMYEERTRQYQKDKPTQAARKKWNRKLRAACIKDYRTWVTGCTERIEKADNRGDTKEIYAEVKRLSGIVSRGANTRPTIAYQEPQESGAAEDTNGAGETSTCAHVTAKATRKDDRAAVTNCSDESEAQADRVTEKNTRKSKNKNARTNSTPRGARGSRDVNFEKGTHITGPAELASN